MHILFLIYHGFSEHSGISKKIKAQIKALNVLGHKVEVCTYAIEANKHRVRKINETILEDYGTSIIANIKKRICFQSIYQYAIDHSIDLVYVRSFHNANPFTINFFKRLKHSNIKCVMEIPTYPYDAEYVGFSTFARLGIQVDKLFRRKLAKQMNAIITFSPDEVIFGQRTIRISNGVNFDEITLKKHIKKEKRIDLIGVAEVHYWHGFDRIINGMGEYYQKPHEYEVYFHIVGGIGPSEMYDSQHAPGFYELINKYQIEPYVIFHDQQFGTHLDGLFAKADFAIGSLARHRSHISKIKTLKNREYAARGIPFIYSETDDDFDHMPYILKAPADESAISIQNIIDFNRNIQISPEEIRKSILDLSWELQMEKIIKSL